MSQEVVERMTKELTASAPSAMKIKVVTPPDNLFLTVGAKRFHHAEVWFLLPDGTIFTVDARRFCCSIFAVCCGLAVDLGKPRVPYRDVWPGAAPSRIQEGPFVRLVCVASSVRIVGGD